MTTKADLQKGKVPTMPALPPHREPRAPWSERKAAYDRARPGMTAILEGPAPAHWSRERWIEHWLKIEADQNALPFALDAAKQALKNLGYRKLAEKTREPGQDDEPETAWTEPLDGDAGDITKKAEHDPEPPIDMPQAPRDEEFSRDAPPAR